MGVVNVAQQASRQAPSLALSVSLPVSLGSFGLYGAESTVGLKGDCARGSHSRAGDAHPNPRAVAMGQSWRLPMGSLPQCWCCPDMALLGQLLQLNAGTLTYALSHSHGFPACPPTPALETDPPGLSPETGDRKMGLGRGDAAKHCLVYSAVEGIEMEPRDGLPAMLQASSGEDKPPTHTIMANSLLLLPPARGLRPCPGL